MAIPSQEGSATGQINAAVQMAFDTLYSAANNVAQTTATMGEKITADALRVVEQGTETVGKFVTPIAENPLIKYAAKVPGINFLTTALGNVDVEKAQDEVDKLRQQYPSEIPAEIAHRIMVDTSFKAGGIGMITNFIPPLALTLFAVDIAAVTTLQAEMIYRIAAAYGFSLKDPARRGEVLTIFAISLGGSSVLKVGLGLIEILPLVGAVVGASSNAALIYSLGYTACRFYEAKINAATSAA